MIPIGMLGQVVTELRRSDAPPPGTYKPKNGINNYPKYESNLPRTRHAFASSEPRAMCAGRGVKGSLLGLHSDVSAS